MPKDIPAETSLPVDIYHPVAIQKNWQWLSREV
jgi:hypothetical protein